MSTYLLSKDLILQWAREFRDRHGRWPTHQDGRIPQADATGTAIDQGLRGLPGDTSLAKLLDKRGNAAPSRNALTAIRILAWADQYHAKHGR